MGGALFTIREGGILTTFSLDGGEILKSERIGEPDTYYASPVAAAGKIITASQSGQLSVIRAGQGGEDWEVISTHNLDEEVLVDAGHRGGSGVRALARVAELLPGRRGLDGIGVSSLAMGKSSNTPSPFAVLWRRPPNAI